MPIDLSTLDYSLLTPVFVVLGLIFVDWLLDLMLPRHQKRWVGWVSVAGLLIAIGTALPLWGTRQTFAGVLRVDEYAVFFEVLFLIMAIGVTLISLEYADRFLPQPGEYYGLVLAGTLGMMLMASATELLTAYLSLELLSFSSYVLVSYARTNLKSNEAGMKYIILGAFSSALLLYGISLVYGALGTSYFSEMASAVSRVGLSAPGLIVGLALITAGFGFKVAAVPFHMWTPDVYEGAPTPITAYLSVGSKAAGFALILRFVVGAFLPVQASFQAVFVLLAAVTMTLGNLVAIQQRNIKRLLAYSSIGQAGYVLVGLAALANDQVIAEQATRGVILHLTGYVFTNLAAFGCVVALQNLNGGRDMITDFAGLARRAPFVALAMMVALFSLAGMPLFAGFVTKFYLFAAAARADLLWLVLLAVINSTISLYYYLLVVYQMYVRPPAGYEEEALAHAPAHAPAPALAVAAPVGTGGVALAERAPVALADGHGGAAGARGNGHAAGYGPVAHADGSAGAGGHGGHGEPGASGDAPGKRWWEVDITMDMPKERAYPPFRVPWVMTVSLLLFLAGIFWIGLWPMPIVDLLQSASRALFAG